MTFTQEIVVLTRKMDREDIEKALTEYHTQTEHGWGYMFEGLKRLRQER